MTFSSLQIFSVGISVKCDSITNFLVKIRKFGVSRNEAFSPKNYQLKILNGSVAIGTFKIDSPVLIIMVQNAGLSAQETQESFANARIK